MRRRRDPEAARAEILAAAEQLVFEQGPQGLKIKLVAKAAGMTHEEPIPKSPLCGICDCATNPNSAFPVKTN